MASIRKRVRQDGLTSWAVLFRDSDTGKQTSRTVATETDAKLLKDFLDSNNQSFAQAAQAASKLRSDKPTLEKVLYEHIDLLTSITPGTRRNYLKQSELHILPSLGNLPVDKITRADIARWLTQLKLSAKSKRNVHAILSAALKYAVEEKYIDANPAVGMKPAAETRAYEPIFLNEMQMSIIYQYIKPEWKLFTQLLENTGLRFGEATALRWRDLDMLNGRGVIFVSRAWKRGEDGMYIGPPKTRKSKRRVSLPLWLTQELLETKGSAKLDDLIFASPHGHPLTSGYFHTNVWIPLIRQVEGMLLARPRVHDLRHTHASRLIAKGVPLPVIQARLGHESISTTVNTYGHLATDADAMAASVLD